MNILLSFVIHQAYSGLLVFLCRRICTDEDIVDGMLIKNNIPTPSVTANIFIFVRINIKPGYFFGA